MESCIDGILKTVFQPRPDRPKRGGKKSSKTGGGGKEAESLPDIPEAEQVKDSPGTKPQPQPSTPVKQEEEPVIHTDCIVFAKFKVGTGPRLDGEGECFLS